MPGAFRTRRVSAAAVFLLSLALVSVSACVPSEEEGYAKVVNRELTYIPPVAKPDPPPVRAGSMPTGAADVQLASVTFPPGVTQAMAEEGQQLYGTVCTACHGAGGAGGPIAPALNDAEWLNISGSYNDIVNVIHSGVANPVQYPGAMPALGGGNFTDEQVRAIAAYIFALSHAQGS